MSGGQRAHGQTAGAVLTYLQQEADLDGLVTVSSREIGEALGMSSFNANQHLRRLADQGVISFQGRTDGIKGHSISAYQLSEEAMA